MTDSQKPTNGFEARLLAIAGVIAAATVVATNAASLGTVLCDNFHIFCPPPPPPTPPTPTPAPVPSPAPQPTPIPPTPQVECEEDILCPQSEPYCSYIDSDDMDYKKSVYEGRCRQWARDNHVRYKEYVIIGQAPGCKVVKVVQGTVCPPGSYPEHR